jgi:hypothetical protein
MLARRLLTKEEKIDEKDKIYLEIILEKNTPKGKDGAITARPRTQQQEAQPRWQSHHWVNWLRIVHPPLITQSLCRP